MKLAQLTTYIGGVFDSTPKLRPMTHCAAIAAAAMLSVAPAAQAVVVTSPAAGIVVPATTAGIYINVVSGASGAAAATTGWDINPWSSTGLSFFTNAAAGSQYVSATGNVAANLAIGSTIGPASTYAAVGTATTTFGAAAGQWSLNATNYFGFSFIGDDTLLHYGYGTMIVGATATVRTVGQLFYESAANTPITIAVPEASTWAMMLLGVAGLGAVVRRRQAR